MEVKYEDEITLLINNDFVTFVVKGDILVTMHTDVEQTLPVIHLSIEASQVHESQLLVVHEGPLSTAVVHTVVISLGWEINPLWVTEFIAHEVEECLTSKSQCDKLDHLVKGNTSAYLQGLVVVS